MTQQNQEYTLHSQILLNPEARSYPCLCLCFGFSQMILIAPLRLMTLHFSQIGLTDALTFTIFSPFQNVRQLLYHLYIKSKHKSSEKRQNSSHSSVKSYKTF